VTGIIREEAVLGNRNRRNRKFLPQRDRDRN
jgi:hypothetical protein